MKAENTAFSHLKKFESVVAKRKVEKPLPIPFELPHNYPAIVMSELQADKLSGKARSKFITCVASAIFKYKNYPTSEEYSHVGSQVIKKYPFLKSSNGTGHVC